MDIVRVRYCDSDQDHEAHELQPRQAMGAADRCPGRGLGVPGEDRIATALTWVKHMYGGEAYQQAKAEWRANSNRCPWTADGTPDTRCELPIGHRLAHRAAGRGRFVGLALRETTDDEPTPEQARIEVLTAWWLEQAKAEIEVMAPRTVEYGGGDLEVIGRELAALNGRPEVSVEEATEIGIAFFIRGKVGRWFNAIKRGQRPSDDTIDDLCVYGRMAKRNREVGSWPGV